VTRKSRRCRSKNNLAYIEYYDTFFQLFEGVRELN